MSFILSSFTPWIVVKPARTEDSCLIVKRLRKNLGSVEICMWAENNCSWRDRNWKPKSLLAVRNTRVPQFYIQAKWFLSGRVFFQFSMSFQLLSNGTRKLEKECKQRFGSHRNFCAGPQKLGICGVPAMKVILWVEIWVLFLFYFFPSVRYVWCFDVLHNVRLIMLSPVSV